jgi:hypothetical protein
MKAILQSSAFHVLSDRERVLVNLPNFDWNFALHTVVELTSGSVSIRLRQCGSGMTNGLPTIMLCAMDQEDLNEVANLLETARAKNESVHLDQQGQNAP